MTDRVYSDAELEAIHEKIVNHNKQAKEDTVHFGMDKVIKNDWDDDQFMSEMYDQYLQAVQQEKSSKLTKELFTLTTTYEDYLRSCLETLKWRREELKRELDSGSIDHRIYNNGKMTAELAEGAIKKHLSKTERARLIGV